MFNNQFILRLLFLTGFVSVLLCSGCWTKHPNYYREFLNDFGYERSYNNQTPEIIPAERLNNEELEAWAQKNGFQILGVSFFESPEAPDYDAIEVAKTLGATHLVIGRDFVRNNQHNEIRTGYDPAFSTTTLNVSGEQYTHGTIYSPYRPGQLNYGQTTYNYGSGVASTTTFVPYHYQVSVNTPIFRHSAAYLVLIEKGN